jgi:hypothetical protein
MSDQTQTKTRERKTYAPINDDDLGFETAPATMVTVLAPTRERDSKPDPQQDKINEVVKASFDQWQAKANGERSFAALLKADLVTLNRADPNKVETIKFKIRKAGTKHGVTVRFGEPGKLDDDGRELISFVAMTKLPAKPRKKRNTSK